MGLIYFFTLDTPGSLAEQRVSTTCLSYVEIFVTLLRNDVILWHYVRHATSP